MKPNTDFKINEAKMIQVGKKSGLNNELLIMFLHFPIIISKVVCLIDIKSRDYLGTDLSTS